MFVAGVFRERNFVMVEEFGVKEGFGKLRWMDIGLLFLFFSLFS